MPFTETALAGAYIIEPRVFEDHRGYFFECYNKNSFDQETGTDVNFVQDNESYSGYGTLRGLHYQAGEHAQAKLVRVIHGKVLDVAVDLRESSPTYGQHITVELSGENKKQLFVPRGFGHGFVVLSETALFAYKCDNFYNKESEGGIIYNDPKLNIDWGIEEKDVVLSEKDGILPVFGNHRKAI
jgi:dTDP-4-dehydrorhamnose 3,5-epimerase